MKWRQVTFIGICFFLLWHGLMSPFSAITSRKFSLIPAQTLLKWKLCRPGEKFAESFVLQIILKFNFRFISTKNVPTRSFVWVEEHRIYFSSSLINSRYKFQRNQLYLKWAQLSALFFIPKIVYHGSWRSLPFYS